MRWSGPGLQPNNKSYAGSVTRDGQLVAVDSETTKMVKPDGKTEAGTFRMTP